MAPTGRLRVYPHVPPAADYAGAGGAEAIHAGAVAGWATLALLIVVWPDPIFLLPALVVAVSFTLLLVAHLTVFMARVAAVLRQPREARFMGRRQFAVTLLKIGVAAFGAALFGITERQASVATAHTEHGARPSPTPTLPPPSVVTVRTGAIEGIETAAARQFAAVREDIRRLGDTGIFRFGRGSGNFRCGLSCSGETRCPCAPPSRECCVILRCEVRCNLFGQEFIRADNRVGA